MNEAAGVTYFEIAGAGGRFFRCEPYRCTVSIRSCSDRWNRAQSATGYEADRLERCRGCQRGAAHSGAEVARYSVLYQLGICPRCRRGGARMLPKYALCVSCVNRQYEAQQGRNAKGTVPQIHLEPRRLTVLVEGKPYRLRDVYTANETEMPLRLLSGVKGRLVFTRATPATPTLSTIELIQRLKPRGPAPLSHSTRRQQRRAGAVARRRRRELLTAMAAQ